ncbi:DnaB-like helicase C-terminal domain-containing protein [Bartonella sp. DGB2]|uniref:DnaB-like helicase C-terminal domain-containing protein n=1 Tax=Bartonella sp. DGB2 TaxID=3388426 RepID=UPI00399001E5
MESLDAEFVTHEPCPNCGSKDNLARYTDGHGYCFGCQYYEKAKGVSAPSPYIGLCAMGEAKSISSRCLTKETCEKWRYTISTYQDRKVHIAHYCDDMGRPIAQKLRFDDKSFKFLGDTKAVGLYGQHLWRDGGKRVVITEGELDALSVSQIQNHKWPVVSLPTGAAGAKRALQKSFEWLNRFEEVVLMFDNDEAGLRAVSQCSTLQFPTGKLRVALLPLKDANEMLKAKRHSEVVDAIFGAKPYRPKGISYANEVKELVKQYDTKQGFTLPYEGLMEKTQGIRLGELWTFAAGTGIGKSTLVRECAYHFLKSGHSVGMLMLEESMQRTALAMVGLAIDKPTHLVWNDLSEDERNRGIEAALDTRRLCFYEHFGVTDLDTIVDKIRYMAVGCECQFIILDHLSFLVSGSMENDERRLIDHIMATLEKLTQELKIGLLLVSHLKRIGGDKGHENGAEISLSHLRGSATIANYSDYVIGLERNTQSEDKNCTTLRVLKSRHTGDTGFAGHLVYTPQTGRLQDAPNIFSPTLEQEEALSPF